MLLIYATEASIENIARHEPTTLLKWFLRQISFSSEIFGSIGLS